MPMHPDMIKAIETMQALGFRPFVELTPDEARAQTEEMARLRAADSEGDGIATENRTIPGPGGEIPIRIYRPRGAAADEVLPVLVYFHGGGFVIGSPDTHDSVARGMCNGARIAVVSVNYRKAPKSKFPAAAEDCYAAAKWVHDNAGSIHVDAHRMAVGGDSAGGNLAAVVALMAREAGGPELRLQLLVYPLTDYDFSTASYAEFAQGYGALTKVGMEWFRDHYLRSEADTGDWRAAPIRAASHAGLPPALFVTAECDVLLDDSRKYIATLKAAGVPVEHAHFDGMIHGFFSMPATLESTAAAHARAVTALKKAFA